MKMKDFLRDAARENNKRKFNRREIIVKYRGTDGEKTLRRATDGAAGYDIYAKETVVIKPGERKLITTGLRMKMGKNIYAQVFPRSGMAIKHGVFCLTGVIDHDYIGNIKVLLINMGERDYAVEKDKNAIAQVVFLRNEHPKFVRTKRLKKTRRNTNGFGSTDTVQVCDGEREYNEEEDGGRC